MFYDFIYLAKGFRMRPKVRSTLRVKGSNQPVNKNFPWEQTDQFIFVHGLSFSGSVMDLCIKYKEILLQKHGSFSAKGLEFLPVPTHIFEPLPLAEQVIIVEISLYKAKE